MLLAALILLLVASRVIAKSIKIETKTETNIEVLQEIVENKITPLPPFPTGTYKVVEVPEKVIKTQQRASTQVTGVSDECLGWIKQSGITDIENAIILINRESHCNPFAVNESSGATGIGQSLPAGKMAIMGDDYLTNPITQLKWMRYYVENRYGTWANAVAHSNETGWY